MKYTPIYTQNVYGGNQEVYRFPNNFGASVIRHNFSYGHEDGLWELAVLEFTDTPVKDHFDLCYTTPITDDVIGSLNEEDVEKLLSEIEALPR